MQWSDINDPKGEFEFNLDWTPIKGEYLSDEIQELINKNGVFAMVHTVNEQLWLKTQHKPLMLVNNDGQKMVVNQ